MKLGPHRIVVVHPGTKQSGYGTNQVLDWSTATRTTVDGCSVQPQAQPEYTDDRDTISTSWVAYVPVDAEIDAIDRIEWTGESYDIDGDVLRWEFGSLSHLVMTLRRSRDEAI